MLVGKPHGAGFSLLFMAPHTPGTRLKELRSRLGLSLRQAAQRGENINHNTIAALETRGGSWDHVELGTLVALARAYGIPIDRLVRFVFVSDEAPDLATEMLKGPEDLEVHPDWVAFPAYDAAEAWNASCTKPDKELVAYIPIEHLIRKGVLRQNVRVYHLNSQCLISEEVRRVEKVFTEGDYVAIDTSRAPNLGEVVMAWCDISRAPLFKRWGVDEGTITFHPLAGTTAPMTVFDDRESRMLGPVVWRGG